MDVPVPMTLIQQLLAWILLAFLLIWMLVFVWLALRPEVKKQFESEAEDVSSSRPQPIPIATAHTRLHQGNLLQTSVATIRHEAAGDTLAEQSVR